MENKTTKMLINVFAGIMGFGLGLIVVSLFLGMVDASVPMVGVNASLGAFDADWDTMDASPIFIIVSFLILIIGIAIMSIDLGLKQKAKKQVKGLNYAALAVIFMGLILVIISTIMAKNAVKDEMIEMLTGVLEGTEGYEDMNDAQLGLVINMLVSFKLGTGAIMGIVGGVFALIGGTLLVLPQFNPIQLSKATEQPAPAPAAAPVAEQPAGATEQPAPTQDATIDPFDNSTNDTIK